MIKARIVNGRGAVLLSNIPRVDYAEQLRGAYQSRMDDAYGVEYYDSEGDE